MSVPSWPRNESKKTWAVRMHRGRKWPCDESLQGGRGRSHKFPSEKMCFVKAERHKPSTRTQRKGKRSGYRGNSRPHETLIKTGGTLCKDETSRSFRDAVMNSLKDTNRSIRRINDSTSRIEALSASPAKKMNWVKCRRGQRMGKETITKVSGGVLSQC